MEIQIWGLAGLYGGMICGLLGWYVGRRKAQKNRGLDETHDHIWTKAKSWSWYATLAGIYILFTLHAVGIEIGTAASLGILMIIHMASWAISGIIFSLHLYSEKEMKISDFSIGIGIIVVSFFFFTVLAIVLDDWLYLLMTIPCSLIGYMFMKQSKLEQEK